MGWQCSGSDLVLNSCSYWPVSYTHLFIPEICKLPYDYLFRDDPVAMAECTLLVHEYLRLDLLIANMDVYNFEAEAMGVDIKFYKDHCPDFDLSLIHISRGCLYRGSGIFSQVFLHNQNRAYCLWRLSML